MISFHFSFVASLLFGFLPYFLPFDLYREHEVLMSVAQLVVLLRTHACVQQTCTSSLAALYLLLSGANHPLLHVQGIIMTISPTRIHICGK
jgi:hypothetical protein